MRSQIKSIFILLHLATGILFQDPCYANGLHTQTQHLQLTEEEVIRLPEEEVDIAESCLIFTKSVYPEIDIEKYINIVEAMAKEVKTQLQESDSSQDIVKKLNDYLFVTKGFNNSEDPYIEFNKAIPNQEVVDYYQNVALNKVLDTKRGNCFGLSALYLSLAERISIPLAAVSCPDHSYVRYDDDKTVINIETTSNGKAFSDEDNIRVFNIHPEAIRQGTYLVSLSKKEFLAYILFNNGVQAGSNRDYNRALYYYDQAIKLNPKLISAYLNRGTIYVRNGNNDQAIEAFNRVLELDPRTPEAYSNRGIIHGRKGNPEQEISDLTKAIELAPEFAGAYFNRGVIYERLKQFDKAMADYERALKLNPGYRKARHALKECSKIIKDKCR